MARKGLEERTVEIGKEIFERMAGETPSIFDKQWWSGLVMDWCMRDPAFKLEMFRFIDVFPQLRSSEAVSGHLKEYFTRPGQTFSKTIQLGIKAGSMFSGAIERNLNRMAGSFIAGKDPESAIPVIARMREQGIGFTMDLLGEKTVSEVEALDYQRRNLELLDQLVGSTTDWKEHAVIDRDADGPIPKVNLSIKVSTLYSQWDPAAGEHSARMFYQRLKPIFLKAKEHGAFVMLDLEHYALKNITYETFDLLLSDPDLNDGPDTGVVVQAYLLDSREDVERWLKRSKKLQRPITIRLVKGAYWDYETVIARQHGWRIPVFQEKAATDENFEMLTDLLLKSKGQIKLAIASHNVRSIAHAMARAEDLGLTREAVEFQTLFGMAEPIKKSLVAMGYRVRDYTTVGELIPGMAYLVRRLLENTSNEGFLRSSFVEAESRDLLLSKPVPTGEGKEDPEKPGWGGSCPHLDFRYSGPHEDLAKAIATFEKKGLNVLLPVVIGGVKRTNRETFPSVYPADPRVVVAQCALAEDQDIEDAIAMARTAWPAWRRRSAEERAQILRRAARIMVEQRFELTALQVFEVAKSWAEADADVCEAIDFLSYYAAEAERLARGVRMGNEPGEYNLLTYQALGVGAVIAPWNFPLAIITGMTSAALAAGNGVLVKPARNSPACGYALYQILIQAGVPKELLHFVPCVGSQVGPRIVEHPDIDFITFTGSMDVGLEIIRRAALVRPGQRKVKRVVVEMGGKNAIIIDDDADLDEAVSGTVYSAFGFQGQKCSACSRVIVVGSAYDAFVTRLVEATRSLRIGPPTSSDHLVGPVIDEHAQVRILGLIEEYRQDFELAIHRQQDVPDIGYYVGPSIFLDADPKHRLCQEEIFGPVLAVIRADSFEQALEIANGTAYALTGGVFSRSPLHLERARAEFDVGNLYLNRGCTGALVGRQPFGGSYMSGVGSKAGGPDYLPQFMEPRTVTENTMRRGFSPETL